ncbi:rod shape-determining protein MreC [Marinobacterium halophilum]|uniref:Cell shape-determining protein MreC n=1 Tax=Marinobacterium halophilum TaxID=267374 RepID=A0A2P8EYP8_9GAMM|nr:rod shape-determining protein MreC [Marinobacterium halophilum]PSL14582.1 rod shape-determining protein MreC [Marinobacterium halophilum]
MLLLLLAALLMVADLNWPKMKEGRAWLSLLVTPLQWVVDIPTRVADNLSGVVVDRATLLRDNEALKSEALILERKVQQMAALTAENIRLRELLTAAESLEPDTRLVELIGVNPDPFQHEVILNQGSEDGVFAGQPVLDAGGVMGQIVSLAHYTSRAMLVTDARSAIPVEVNRNGFRSIALGKGTLGELELEHVPDTVDIREGDLLVTSGLGGRFPRGYPVARVREVVRDPGRPFTLVRAEPAARLDRSRHLLLVDYRSELTAAVRETVDD